MFREMGTLSPRGYDQLMPASIEYFLDAIPSGTYLAWLAEEDGRVVGGGGMIRNAIAPRPGPDGLMLPPGVQGLILNVFVEAHARQRGIAQELMWRMIEFARQEGIASLVLHASKAGRPLYEKLGFTETSEMRLYL